MKGSVAFTNCVLVLLLASLVGLGGCQAVGDFFKIGKTQFFSADKVIKAPDRTSINPILPSIGMADVSQEIIPNATFPTEGDWEYSDTDYIIGPTDFLQIQIMDLFQEGMETPLQREVADSDFIAVLQNAVGRRRGYGDADNRREIAHWRSE